MRVFISYKQRAGPDSGLACAIHDGLSAAHQPFLAERSIRLTEDWSAAIDRELDGCDFFIVLLTEHSVVTEMVIAELEKAYRLRKQRSRPAIIPIRVAYPAPLPYAVSGYLTSLQGLWWHQDSDTARVVADVVACVSGGANRVVAIEAAVGAPEFGCAFSNCSPRTPWWRRPSRFQVLRGA